MTRIAIVYFTESNVTEKIAEAIVSGIKQEDGITVILHRIAGQEIIEGRFENPELFQQLKSCDAILFGSPTYMGSVSAQFKAFADASSEYWQEQEWADKISAGFTTGTGLNGDQSSTLQYMSTLASQHGMLWVNIASSYGVENNKLNRLGCQLGVVSQATKGSVHEVDLATAKHLGRRVAKLTLRLNE
ncbi:flavodoxin family protein [Thalassotalea castellviae]|uniref:Flavodoxin family protein n=1 Tax=Thalassotalea castellviae TaxID=3075612 RepID=A0ABU3A4Z0_9GAMM|nr:flavodoxin family protein [Thalassotalea sp. W431]MDT0605243.1 flavodoxin family protein [Thalassotalea sp. W431]